jgi:5-methylcytosine-specific restriction endonuclease McrA
MTKWKAQRGKCYYCNIKMLKGEPPKNLKHRKVTRDHKIPRCEGGMGGDNIVLACWKCNTEKGCMSVEEFQLLRILLEEKP